MKLIQRHFAGALCLWNTQQAAVVLEHLRIRKVHARLGSDVDRNAGGAAPRVDRGNRPDGIATVVQVFAEHRQLSVAHPSKRIRYKLAGRRRWQPADRLARALGMYKVLEWLLNDTDIPMIVRDPRAHALGDDIPDHAYDEARHSFITGRRVECGAAANALAVEILDIAAANVAAHLRRPVREATQQLIAIPGVRESLRAQAAAPERDHLIAIGGQTTQHGTRSFRVPVHLPEAWWRAPEVLPIAEFKLPHAVICNFMQLMSRGRAEAQYKIEL